jgi:hypothetical protein
MTTPTWDSQVIDPQLLYGYGYNDQITYGGFTLPRFLYYMLAGLNQVNIAVGEAAQSFLADSVSSETIGVGAKTLTVSTGKAFAVGMNVVAWKSDDPAIFMIGEVTAYNPVSGVLAFTVAQGDFAGSGTYSTWKIALSGRRGAQGAPSGVSYLFGTDTTATDPGNGIIKLNNASTALVTEIYVDLSDAYGGSVLNWLDTIGASTNTVKGQIQLQSSANFNVFALYEVTAYAVEAGFRRISVDFLAASGSFASLERVVLNFYRAGDAGATGATGATGSGVNINASTNGTLVTAAPRSTLNATWSIEAVDDGANDRFNLRLKGETASPGNSKYYGTDEFGVRGMFPLPVIGSTETNAQTTDYTLTAGDLANVVRLYGTNSRTFTLPSAPVVGAGWYCYLENDCNDTAEATDPITLLIDPPGAQLVDGEANIRDYRGALRLLYTDGINWFSQLLRGGMARFVQGGTFYAPSKHAKITIDAVSAGAGAGDVDTDSGFGGGGGGRRILEGLQLSANTTVTVTIGAGGAGNVGGAGGAGGNSSFGSYLTVYGATATGGVSSGGGAAPDGGPKAYIRRVSSVYATPFMGNPEYASDNIGQGGAGSAEYRGNWPEEPPSISQIAAGNAEWGGGGGGIANPAGTTDPRAIRLDKGGNSLFGAGGGGLYSGRFGHYELQDLSPYVPLARPWGAGDGGNADYPDGAIPGGGGGFSPGGSPLAGDGARGEVRVWYW